MIGNLDENESIQWWLEVNNSIVGGATAYDMRFQKWISIAEAAAVQRI